MPLWILIFVSFLLFVYISSASRSYIVCWKITSYFFQYNKFLFVLNVSGIMRACLRIQAEIASSKEDYQRIRSITINVQSLITSTNSLTQELRCILLSLYIQSWPKVPTTLLSSIPGMTWKPCCAIIKLRNMFVL